MAEASHFFETDEGFEGAKEHTACNSAGQTRNIQTVVIAVDEVNVGEAGRTEENRITRGFADGGMGSHVLFTEIGLGLDNATGEDATSVAANEKLAQEFTGNDAGIAVEECTGQRVGVRSKYIAGVLPWAATTSATHIGRGKLAGRRSLIFLQVTHSAGTHPIHGIEGVSVRARRVVAER